MQTTTTLTARSLSKDIALVLIASFLIALSGALFIPLWFTPVPLGFRNLVVLLTGALLGPKRGSAAVFAFLLQGAMGLPVFLSGHIGVPYMLGPNGGYLLGYLIAAYVVGAMVERRGKSPLRLMEAMLIGIVLIQLCGVAYLSTFVGLSKAFLLGSAPFLLGDLLKAIFGARLLSKFLGKSLKSEEIS